MRKYELMWVVDPRLSDEETATISEEYQEMLTAGGVQQIREESWGKRRLAYPIEKLNEGRYILFRVEAESDEALRQVAQRMGQHDKVLRYLTVRVDSGRLRLPKPKEAEAAEGEGTKGETGSSEEAAS